MRCFLSLGSNLGDRAENIKRALDLLEASGVKIIQRSSLYETQPVDLASQPWFYNQVVEAECRLDPQLLLAIIKDTERKMGRKSRQPKGPRLIDIDILLAGEAVIQSEDLIIPHPRLEKRNFVLIPLKEISPDTIHPLLGERVEVLWQKSKDKSVVRKIAGWEK